LVARFINNRDINARLDAIENAYASTAQLSGFKASGWRAFI